MTVAAIILGLVSWIVTVHFGWLGSLLLVIAMVYASGESEGLEVVVPMMGLVIVVVVSAIALIYTAETNLFDWVGYLFTGKSETTPITS